MRCATTAEWTQQRRKPRQRTGRRATRSSRLRDMQELSSVLAYEASSEQEFELGRFPVQAMGLLATCIEEDGEGAEAWQSCGLDVFSDASSASERLVESGRAEVDPCSLDTGAMASDLTTVDEADLLLHPRGHVSGVSHGVHAQSVSGNCSRQFPGGQKRKLKDVEFVAIDRDGVVEQMAVEKERQLDALLQFNPVSFVAQTRIPLMSLKARLEGPCPTTTAEVIQIHCHVEEDLKKLSKLTFSPGVHGQAAVDIIRLIRQDILGDHNAFHGWLSQTAADLGDFGNYDKEDQMCFFRYFGEEMMEHSSSLEYRLEQIDGFVSPEEQ